MKRFKNRSNVISIRTSGHYSGHYLVNKNDLNVYDYNIIFT